MTPEQNFSIYCHKIHFSSCYLLSTMVTTSQQLPGASDGIFYKQNNVDFTAK